MLKTGKRKLTKENIKEQKKIWKAEEKYMESDNSNDEHSDYHTDDEEKDLEAFLFSNSKSSTLNERQEEPTVAEETNNILSFTISTKPSNVAESDDDDDEVENTSILSPSTKPAAWYDEDDAGISVDIVQTSRLRKLKNDINETKVSGDMYQERLKKQFEKVLPAPAWADLTHQNTVSKNLSGDEDEIFNTARNLTSKSSKLRKEIIDISRLKNINHSQACHSTVTSLQFHPHAQIAFTASLDKKLYIFQADGNENRKLHSVHMQNFPIYSACFSNDGDTIFMSSRRKFFYRYDLKSGNVIKVPQIRGCREENSLEKFVISPDGEMLAFLGNNGYIHLVSSKTCHLITSFKINAKVLSSTFSPDSTQLFASGSNGEVYIWNINTRKCQHRFVDDGSLKTFSLAASTDAKYIATGSSSGVVNIYDSSCLTSIYPQPLKSVMNLTTSVDRLCFNKTSELLCISSPQKRNALRLIHIPSMTTFSNWPIEKQTLGNVSCSAFSPSSGMLGIGNEDGKALLFRLHHFDVL